MGFPDEEIRAFWLNDTLNVEYPELIKERCGELKNKEIPVLNNYEGSASAEFWDKFPKNNLPVKASTRVNVDEFEKQIDKVKDKMTGTEFCRAQKAVRDLKEGAGAYQKSELPPMNSYNARSAYDNGALLTDTIATWVKKGFVAGPFETPPKAGFRANPLAAVARNNKVRPILNMSGPRGARRNSLGKRC